MFFRHLATQYQDSTLVSLQQQLSNLHDDIKLIHILGHTGVPGNDTADSLANDVAHQLLRGEISAPNTISRPAAFEVARDISLKLWQRSWDYNHTARYTYNVILSVQTRVLFPLEQDTGISYVRLLLHDTMLEDDSYRTGTSTSSACECRSGRETAEHFLLHCTRYQHIRKDTIDLALDILNCSKKASFSELILPDFPKIVCEVLLLSPSIDGITKSENTAIKDLLFEFLSSTKRSL